MKARLPKGMGGGSNNMNSMLKQAQKMQEEMTVLQEQLDETEYTATAGNGMVQVTITGKHQIKSLKINPEIIDPDDSEMIEDLVTVAINEAMREADEAADTQMNGITGGMNLPGIF